MFNTFYKIYFIYPNSNKLRIYSKKIVKKIQLFLRSFYQIFLQNQHSYTPLMMEIEADLIPALIFVKQFKGSLFEV